MLNVFISKISKFFKNPMNLALSFFSALLALNSLFLISEKTKDSLRLLSFESPKIILLFHFFLSFLVIGAIFFFPKKINFQKSARIILLVYAPSVIILMIGMQKLLCLVENRICLTINNILPIFLVAYMILLGYFIITKRKKNPSKKSLIEIWEKKFNKISISIIFLIFLINLSFGTYHLSKMAAVDEALWTFDRIPKFWNNVMDGEWHKTRISDKPGITVALVSGAGMLFLDPKEYKSISWKGNIYGPEKNIEDMNFAFRFPILLFNALLLFVFYFFLRKLLGEKAAVFSVIFIGLSPILLGISTIINPDSLLWIFLPLSIISYFIYKKEDEDAYLYWAGIFMGFSLLTKYVANILFIFFFLTIFLDYIFNKENYPSVSTYLKKSIIDYFTLIFFSLLTFMAFLPASWIEFSKVLDGTIFSKAFQRVWPTFLGIMGLIVFDIYLIKGKTSGIILGFFSKYKRIIFILFIFLFSILILAAFANTYFEMKWYDFEPILASPKSSFSYGGFLGLILANFYSLIFGISPLAFLAIVSFLLIIIFFRKIIDQKEYFALSLLIFILLYYFASTVQAVSATVRYQIVSYPLSFIVAAIGLEKILSFKRAKKYIPELLVYFILIIFSVYTLIFIKPFYFSYASEFLPQKYVLNLKDMGDGSYEAAQYLNSLPNSVNLRVWTDKNGVCTFFKGNYCSSNIDKTADGDYFDYFVLSAGRESRTSKMVIGRANGGNNKIIRLDKLYESDNVDWKLEIGGRPNNFVKIIGADKI